MKDTTNIDGKPPPILPPTQNLVENKDSDRNSHEMYTLQNKENYCDDNIMPKNFSKDTFVLVGDYATLFENIDSSDKRVTCSTPNPDQQNLNSLLEYNSSPNLLSLNNAIPIMAAYEDNTKKLLNRTRDCASPSNLVNVYGDINENSFDRTQDFDDSVIDPTYLPCEENVRKTAAIRQLNDSFPSLLPSSTVSSAKKRCLYSSKNSEKLAKKPNLLSSINHCQYLNCNREIFSCCQKCYCFLCWIHFDNEESFNNCNSHRTISDNPEMPVMTYPKNGQKQANRSLNIPVVSSALLNSTSNGTTEQHCEYANCNSDVFSTCEKCFCFLCWQHYDVQFMANGCHRHKPYSTETNVETKRTLRGSKKAISKILRNSGKAYYNNKKEFVPGRIMEKPCSNKCRLDCKNKIPEVIRKELFEDYWALGELTRQRDFIQKHMDEVKPKYRYPKTCECEDKRRSLNHAFYFTIANNRIRVCKQFFKATLGVNDRVIRTVITKTNEKSIILKDNRGRHDNHRNKSSEHIDVHQFINSIPRIESHYLRAQTTKEYIEGGLTITQLYKDYKRSCMEQQKPYLSITMFSKIFHEDFNISFFVPKKDLCETCVAYENCTEIEKEKQKEFYNNHIREKKLSRKEKENDKEKVCSNFVVACYDLQAVLPSPRGDVSLFYYISKVATYNFTISELKTKDTTCYVWHEGQGHRGVTEIGSCVYKYIQNKSKEVDSDDLEIIFYSDNCCGQQKNKIMISTYIYAVNQLKIKSITHKFLVKGHTQNEGDAVHSVIEKQIKRALKTGPIYTPEEYVTLIKTAKKTAPYFKVQQLCYSDFYDLKTMCDQIGNNFSKTVDNQIIKMHNITIVKVMKTDPSSIYVKTSYENNEFLKIAVRKNQRRNFSIPPILSPAYTSKIPVCDKKKKAILKLIENNHIPKIYFNFYDSL